jgi:glyoxylase-like metal-dependent hydrolase (beta-lactamase superfamily II)
MPRWLGVTLTIAVVLLLAGGGAYYWLIFDTSPPAAAQPFAFDIAAVRAKADELPGGKAGDVRVEKVAAFELPSVAAQGGFDWSPMTMTASSFQVVLPTDTIIVDAAFNAQQGASISARIDEDAYARMDMALAQATQIVVTHEHSDHIGGIVAYNDPQGIARALRLNKEQLENLPRYDMTWPAALSDYAPIEYTGMLAIAPGVVLIRAPGHTPGSQMIYVRREDGRELLFVGDIAWRIRNIETGQGRPRLLSDILLKEERDAVSAELAMLKALHEAEPDLLIVPGHDPAAIDALIASGAMTAQFSL